MDDDISCFHASALRDGLAVATLPTKAATLFHASGSFGNGATLTGTVTIDTTTGTVTAGSLTGGSPISDVFANLLFGVQGPTSYQLGLQNAAGTTNLQTAIVVTTLVGYSGGSISGNETRVSTGAPGAAFTGTLSLTPPASVPAPAGFAVLGAGLPGLGLARRGRG